MKRWLISAAFFALGLFFYFCVFGYGFLGLLLCFCGAVAAVFALLYNLRYVLPIVSPLLRKILRMLCILAILLAVITGIWIGVKSSGAEDPQQDYVIVLGAGVNGTQPSLSLAERLRATKTYLETYPEAVAVLSGGQGDNEDITEAKCMYDWLTERGIDPNRLRLEDKATSTEENLRFSLDLIEAETGSRPDTVAVISAEYHLGRASMLAKNEGVTMLGYGAESTNKFFLCNMYLREICGVWYTLLDRLF